MKIYHEINEDVSVALKEQAVHAAAVLKKHVERYGAGDFSQMEYLKGISYCLSTI
jgi:imidazoleglycerol phosphate dehydratase HisB